MRGVWFILVFLIAGWYLATSFISGFGGLWLDGASPLVILLSVIAITLAWLLWRHETAADLAPRKPAKAVTAAASPAQSSEPLKIED